MSLDVPVPDPPHIEPSTSPADTGTGEPGVDPQRREELAAYLEEGAWQDGFAEWAEYTDLTADEFARIRDRGLVDALDFAWDPETDDVEHFVPPVPDDLGDTATVSQIASELDDLGRAVSEAIEAGYLGRDGEFGFFTDEQ